MSPQTNYSLNTNPSIPGVGLTNDYTAFSYTNPNQAVKAGQGVVAITGQPKECDLPSTSGDKFIGIVMRDASQPATGLPTDPNTDPLVITNFPPFSEIAVMSRGQRQVYVDQSLTAGDPVYLIYASQKQVQTLTFSGAVTSGQTINLEIDGNTITVPFDTDMSTTLGDAVTAILATSDPAINGVTTNHTNLITITANTNFSVNIQVANVSGSGTPPTIAVAVTEVEIPTSDIGSFRKDAAGGSCAFQISTGVRWLEDSVTGNDGSMTCMLDINIPA